MTMRRLLLVSLLVGCGSTSPDELVRTTTPVTDVEREDGAATIPFTIVNGSQQVVLLDRCGPDITLTVEQRTIEGWTSYSGGVCNALLLSVPLELEPGESAAGEVGIGVEGEFRLRANFTLKETSSRGLGAPSPAFTVR
jgi:hypothetical protein